MRAFTLCWTLVLAGLPCVAAAETVRGRIVSADTGRPVPGAFVGEAPAGESSTFASAKGEFSLPISRLPFKIVVEAEGYLRRSVTIDKAGPVVVSLTRDPDASSEVVVVKGRAPDEARQTTYELSASELRKLPGTGNDTLKSLQSLPGVARVPFGAGGLVLRGSSPRDTNVYIDGIEVSLLYHFGGLASVFPSATLESVELSPGAFGAEYGSARGGLVTVNSRAGRSDRWRMASEVSLIDAQLRADGPAAGGTWSLGLRRSYVDAVLALAFPDDSDIALTVAPRYYDGQVRYDVTPTTRDTISVFFFGSDDRMEISSTDPVMDPDDPDGFSFETGFARAGVRWRHSFDNNALLSVTPFVGIDRYELRVDDQGSTRSDIPLGVRTSLWKGTSWGALNFGLSFTGARSSLFIKNDPPPMPGVQQDIELEETRVNWFTDVGVFFEPSFRFANGRVVVKPGVRIDRYGLSDDWAIDPRLSVTEKLSQRWRLKQSIGIYHQPILPVDTVYGDAEINASYALQAASSVEAKLPGNVEATATVFGEQSYGIPVDIVTSASPASAGGSPSSGGTAGASSELLYEQFGRWGYLDDVGRGRSYGLELLVKYASPQLFAWLSYTYSRSLRRGDPSQDAVYRPFVFDQPHVLTALASYKLGRSWQLGARIRYASGNPFTPVAGTYYDANTQAYTPIDGDILSDRLPAFFQLDLRVDRSWKASYGQWSLFLDIQNATNRVNPEGLSYNFDYTQIDYTRGLPIFPSIGVEFKQ